MALDCPSLKPLAQCYGTVTVITALPESPVVALVAVTVTWYVPAGVPGTNLPPPPQPTSNTSTVMLASTIASRRRVRLLFLTPNTVAITPSSDSNAAYSGGDVFGPNGNTAPLLP